jgi:hypothetical protein
LKIFEKHRRFIKRSPEDIRKTVAFHKGMS